MIQSPCRKWKRSSVPAGLVARGTDWCNTASLDSALPGLILVLLGKAAPFPVSLSLFLMSALCRVPCSLSTCDFCCLCLFAGHLLSTMWFPLLSFLLQDSALVSPVSFVRPFPSFSLSEIFYHPSPPSCIHFKFRKKLAVMVYCWAYGNGHGQPTCKEGRER
jgi:hypothetical protein